MKGAVIDGCFQFPTTRIGCTLSVHRKISSEEIASVVHDVRQMLAVITGRAGLLRRGADGLVVEESLAALEAAAVQAGTILSRLLPALNDKPSGCCEISRTLFQSAILMTPQPGVSWNRESQAQDYEVGVWNLVGEISDEYFTTVPQSILLEVLNNLLLNALGVMPDGGQLRVELERAGEFWKLSLQDSGPGILPEHRDRIFEAGFSSSAEVGRGVGLSTCRELLLRHGAEVRLEPARQGGACFEVLLPYAESLPEDASDANPTGGELFRPAVLVVDDEQAVREMLHDVLVELGCRVKVARDAPGAAEIFPTEPFEMVLIDQTLPGMSGLEFAEGLRKQNPHLVLVLISGWGQEEILDKALGSVVDLVGEKPITVEKIMEILNEAGVLRRQRLEGS